MGVVNGNWSAEVIELGGHLARLFAGLHALERHHETVHDLRRGRLRVPGPAPSPGTDDRIDSTLTPQEAAVILIVLKAQIRPEKRDEWLAGIKQYSSDVRQEPGNVSFDYYANGENPHEFVIVETFADSAAGSAHVATEHATKFFAWMPAMITVKPKINYQDIDGEAWSEMAEVTPE